MSAYPSTLPRPQVEGYGIEPDDPVIKTEMDGGNTRFRRRYTAFPSQITARWTFTQHEFAVFEAWHRHTILDGAAWFDVDLANGLGISSHEAHFVGMWKSSALPGLGASVSATLMVRSRPTLTAAELEVATAYAIDDITYAAPTLHAWLHTTMPAPAYF